MRLFAELLVKGVFTAVAAVLLAPLVLLSQDEDLVERLERVGPLEEAAAWAATVILLTCWWGFLWWVST